MKTEIIVTFSDITQEELQAALQAMRDIEQHDPVRIFMTMMVNAPEMTTEEMAGMLDNLKPGFPFKKVLTKSTMMGASRAVNQESNRKCRVCGCTDNHACLTKDGPCSWVAPDLCSACAAKMEDHA